MLMPALLRSTGSEGSPWHCVLCFTKRYSMLYLDDPTLLVRWELSLALNRRCQC